jgi:hypothetical protein
MKNVLIFGKVDAQVIRVLTELGMRVSSTTVTDHLGDMITRKRNQADIIIFYRIGKDETQAAQTLLNEKQCPALTIQVLLQEEGFDRLREEISLARRIHPRGQVATA